MEKEEILGKLERLTKTKISGESFDYSDATQRIIIKEIEFFDKIMDSLGKKSIGHITKPERNVKLYNIEKIEDLHYSIELKENLISNFIEEYGGKYNIQIANGL